jgi:hypothetical protein
MGKKISRGQEMKLSIFLAGIRTQNWKALYDSIPNATSLPESEYEVIFVGPYGLPTELQDKPNVKFIEDWGSPTRCCQIGLLEAKGEYVTWIVDDAKFCPGLAIDKAFAVMPNHDKGIVTFKYFEGPVTEKIKRVMGGEDYWYVRGHPLLKKCSSIPQHYKLTLLLLTRGDYFRAIGGFDCCKFEQVGFGCNDLAIRFQNDGAEVILGERLLDMDFERGGLHAAIEQAVNENDSPVFFSMYHDPKNVGRARIDVNNWKQSPDVWRRRFNPDRSCI